MKKILVVVDMQNDFVDGALGTPEAQAIIDKVEEKILGFDGQIIATYDTHGEDYLSTAEGRKLPVVHCIKGSKGWQLNERVSAALEKKGYISLEKPTFGATELPDLLRKVSGGEGMDITVIGLCTDICVVSCALLLKANFYEMPICVDSACCAGVTPATHNAALETMRMCQIDVL